LFPNELQEKTFCWKLPALHLHLHPGHPVRMGGLTDALIEEQAFRQEFEEAVRAEIKHVP